MTFKWYVSLIVYRDGRIEQIVYRPPLETKVK